MATTYAYAKTNTKTRIEFILNHFRSALCRLTEYTSSEIDEILEGIKNEEIESLEFIGYQIINDKHIVFVRVKLSLDFDEHHKLKSSQPLITYENKFEDENSPEIFGFIHLAQQTIKRQNLASTTFYGYTKSVRENPRKLKEVRIKYGTSPNDIAYDYSQLTQIAKCKSPEAPELSAECHL